MPLSRSPLLWRQAHDALRQKDKDVIPLNFVTKPEDLIAEVERYVSQSKGRPIRLSNGENLFVRDLLQKVSKWMKKFVEVGDTVVQHDPGHAALPWALLRLVLQMSMNNVEKHAAVLEGIETISYYLVWSKIEEASLAVPFEAHTQLEFAFIQLYTMIFTFTARSIRFLSNKSRRLVTAFFSSGSKFQQDVEQMASQRQLIESYVQQISDQTNHEQYAEILSIRGQLLDLNQPLIRVENIVQSTSASISQTEIQHILDWASEIPFQKHFRLAREKALAGTGDWLFQHREFTAWQTCSRSQILWLHGGAGTGKSTLFSMVNQSLVKAHEHQRAPCPIYFFCSRNTVEPERADPEHILRSLMRQASDLPGGPPLHQTLKNRYEKRRTQGDVSAEEAIEIIITTIEDRPVTYILIDALDECDRRRREVLIDALKTILAESKSLVKIFVTSRDNHQDIAWSMRGFPALCIDASQNQTDIVHYVQYSVQRAIDRKKLLPTERVTVDVQEAIVDSLCNGADGMFRWVELQLEFLYTLRKTSILLKRLKRLPPGLEKIYAELYQQNICELDQEQAEVVKSILSWLLVAKVPLSPQDLCQLVCAPDKADMSIETILDMTFDLVRLDTEQDQFRFSHLSVREFLEKRSDDFSQELLHSMATCTCLRLLTEPETIDIRGYAALYWPNHAEDTIKNGGGPRIAQQLETFLNAQNSYFRQWNTEMFHAQREIGRRSSSFVEERLSQVLVEPGSPLLIAACFGLTTCVHKLISYADEWIDTKLKNQEGEDALYLASLYGAVDVVGALLDQGAAVHTSGGYYGTALQAAAFGGYAEITKLLLDKGANVNRQNWTSRTFDNEITVTALQGASYGGHTEVVVLLLDRGARINAREGKYGTALQAASARGYVQLVKLLLEKGADVNISGITWQCDEVQDTTTALYSASAGGHADVVKLLLDQGADVNAKVVNTGTVDDFEDTALHAAVDGGHTKIVELLLGKGADINALRAKHDTALYIAINQGHPEIVRLLLDKTVNFDMKGTVYVNGEDMDTSNILQAISYTGDTEAVTLLLDRDASSKSQAVFYDSALQAASFAGHIEVIRLLLNHGADVDAQGDNHGTALRAASHSGHIEITKLFLARGANIHAQGGGHSDALQAALEEGHTEMAKFLLDQGAKFQVQNGLYGNALTRASHRGDIETVKLLLDQGVDINMKGDWPGTALYAAADRGHITIVELLLNKGADINMKGEDTSGTALRVASFRGYTEIVNLLLNRGANVDVGGGWTGTALQAASGEGYLEVVRLLLDKDADVDKHDEIRHYYTSTSTALCSASANGHIEVVKLLLDKGAKPDIQGRFDVTALQAASDQGHTEVVKLLLDGGADVNVHGGFKGTALQAASNGGHMDVVKLLLNGCADINIQTDSHGTAVQAASYTGHIEMVKLLLDYGADLNIQGEKYGTALQAASDRGNTRIAKLLLDNGADVNGFTLRGGCCSTAIQAASYGGHTEVVKLLLDYGVDVNAQGGRHGSALQAASSKGHIEAVQLLLNNGADLYAQGGPYGTALQAASYRGHLGIVKVLLNKGASVHTLEGQYGNALQAASYTGGAEVVKLLLDYGANVHTQGGLYGNTLQAACAGGDVEVVKLLIHLGADVNAQGGVCGSALYAASGHGHIRVVQLLLEQGADVNAEVMLSNEYTGDEDDKLTDTALCAAARGDHLEVVELLLGKGADINAQGDEYGTALSAAAYMGNIEIVRLLLDEGADIDAEGGWNGTALEAASDRGYQDIVKLLSRHESAARASIPTTDDTEP